MRFQILQAPNDGAYTFQLLDDQDTVLLTSESYDDRDACTEDIREAIQAMNDADRFEIQPDDSLTLTDDNGRVLARSQPSASREEAESLVAQINERTIATRQFDVTFTRTTTRRRSTPSAPTPLSRSEFAALYNFLRSSQSGSEGFELFQSQYDQEYYFHFNDKDGRALLFSRGFSTAGQRDNRLESVIRSASIDSRYEIIKGEDDQFFFILKARNGQEIARSRMFASHAEASEATTFLQKMAPSYADQYIKPKTKRDRSGTDEYLLGVPSPTNEPGFATFRNPDTKRHYFHLNDQQGQPVLFSQGYTSARGRDNGVRSVIRNSTSRASFVPKEENGSYYFGILAGNRQEIARSRNFKSAADRDAMITLLLTWVMQYADAFGVTLDSETTSTTETFTFAAPLIPPTPEESEADATAEGADSSDTSNTTGEDTATDSTLSGFASIEDTDEGQAKEDTVTDDTMHNITEGTSLAGDGGEDPEKDEDTEIDDEGELSKDAAALSGDGASEEPQPPGTPLEDEEEETVEYEYAHADDDRGGNRLWLPWVIGLLLLLLLLFLLRGCFGRADLPPRGVAGVDEPGQETVAQNEAGQPDGQDGSGSVGAIGSAETDGPSLPADADSPTTTEDATAETATSEPSTGDGGANTPLGPTAQELGFAPGSLAATIADMLSRGDRSLPQTFLMDKVNFPVNSAKLNKDAYPQVDDLVKLLSAYPDVVFEFLGHIDRAENENSAKDFMNGEDITLSEVRARCLVKKLEERNIDSSQLDFTGLGATKPVSNGSTAEDRQKNRRLELLVRLR